jgi:Uma2 family endonuclease
MPPTTTDAPAPAAPAQGERAVHYPDCDGQPMSDNTVQYQYIVSTVAGYQELYADRSDVLVAGDLLWYPVEGDNVTRTAPDTLIAFGRPPGPRGSYKQWEEGGIAPQVVFEILSPGNRLADRNRKLAFYDQFGIEEFYEYDPDRGDLAGWLRESGRLRPIAEMEGWISPRTGVKFALRDGMLELTRPDGRRFLTYDELIEQRMLADAEHQRAETEHQRAEAERQRADHEQQRAERMAAKLRELGVDPETAGPP